MTREDFIALVNKGKITHTGLIDKCEAEDFDANDYITMIGCQIEDKPAEETPVVPEVPVEDPKVDEPKVDEPVAEAPAVETPATPKKPRKKAAAPVVDPVEEKTEE